MRTEAEKNNSPKLAVWERPAMSRLDAADAEAMVGAGSDMMGMKSMNS